MQDVIIYTTPICHYCDLAKALLDSLKVPYTSIDISTSALLRDEMIKRSNGRRTVPQIFIGETHIGGFDELNALNKVGRLQDYLTS
jgi:glutaredoxin 3